MPADRPVNLLERLRQSGLLDDGRLKELAALPEARNSDPRPLGRLVLNRGWLTLFQINQVAQGRARELRIGPYLLLDRLGEGGMGQVFKARHEHMNRIVALKVIRKERLRSPPAVQRFHQEVQAAAQLHHPNIVIAYDAGQDSNTHYLAMEFVDGADMARLVKEKGPLPISQACDYIRQAALGLQHAAERGMVHRDIKPHNLLVTATSPAEKSARASDWGTVKILDMGLARLQQGLTEAQRVQTQMGAVLGTPEYLAPEQALDSRAADTRSDLYSLGCTFYFLLTGRPPFQAETMAELLLKHQMEEPTPLSDLRPDVLRGVTAVVAKMLAKKPEDRYQKPAEVVAAIAPFCAAADGVKAAVPRLAASSDDNPWQSLGEGPRPAVNARAVSRTEADRPAPRRQLADGGPRRQRILIGIGAAAVGLLGVVLLLVWLLSSSKSPSSEPVADNSQRTTQHTSTPTQPSTTTPRGAFPYFASEIDHKSPLARLDPAKVPAGDRPAALKGVVAVLKGHTRTIWSVAFSPDGKTLASSGLDSSVRLWDLTGPQPRVRSVLTQGLGGGVAALSFSPDGRFLAFGSQQNVLQIYTDLSALEPKLHTQLSGLSLSNNSAVFSPDSHTLANTVGGRARLLDLRQEKPTERFFASHTQQINAMAFSPNGKLLVTGANDPVVRLWDVSTGDPKELAKLDAKGTDVWSAAFSPDSRTLVVGCRSGDGRIWDVSGPAPRERARFPNDGFWLSVVGFDPNGETFVTYGLSLIRWDATNGHRREEWQCPIGINAWAWSPDRQYAALVGKDQNIVYMLRLATPAR